MDKTLVVILVFIIILVSADLVVLSKIKVVQKDIADGIQILKNSRRF